MGVHLYLSMVPEALVASMLPPAEFGTYLAVGTRKRARGKAMFLDLKEGFQSDALDLASAAKRCVPHPDGQPKHSVYLAIYRVLERVPVNALNSLWLVTEDGRVLELQAGPAPEEFPVRFHLYQELCPVHPLIASSLHPMAFTRFITDPSQSICVPRICFVDLDLMGLANDPHHRAPGCLPYPYMEHIRDCLRELADDATKHTKTVDRIHPEAFPYRCIKSGFFVGDQDATLHYPFPSSDELETTHYRWWRSANA